MDKLAILQSAWRQEYTTARQLELEAKQRKAQLASDLIRWDDVIIPSKRQSKAHKKTAQHLRHKYSRSMMDMGAEKGHKLSVNLTDNRTKMLFAKHRRRLENKGKVAFGR